MTRFEEQLAEVYDDAVRFARALAGSEADGDDLLQDALLKAFLGYARLRNPDSFRFWLLRIIGNTQRSRARGRKIRRWLSLDFAADLPADAPLPFEEREAVRRALGRLPEAQREALVLYEVLGMAVAEIARIQGQSDSAVKSRLARGRERLRAHYTRLSNQEPGHGTEAAR